MSKKHSIIDLFSGCGGFGLGAELAGFHTVAAIDIDPVLQSSYKKNFPKTQVISGDLSQMDEDSWALILQDIQIDGVIGGPPCQGYSRIGHSNIEDPRRSLLVHFFRNVNIIKPKFFVMENVEGLLDKKNYPELENAISGLSKEYTVLPPFVVDASKLGAPTKRRRVIVVGYNQKFVRPLGIKDFTDVSIAPVCVRDAISDLSYPIPQSKDPENYGWAPYKNSNHLSEYAKKMRTVTDGVGWVKALEKSALGQASGYFDTTHSPEIMERYKNTQPGEIDSISRSKKLEWHGVSPTLRAGTGSDKGSYQAVRPLHPEEPRVITVREAARLQGFPDWFIFHPTKWHSFRMIGNSVSPIVSEVILKIIKWKIEHNIDTESSNGNECQRLRTAI